MSYTIFEKSHSGHRAYSLPKVQGKDPRCPLRECPMPLPEVSELDLTRHFSELASKNVGVDGSFYPLGSCTMKFNPRINERAAALDAFTGAHPLAPEEDTQGCLELIYDLERVLCDVCGMDAATLSPCAGAQGEYVGVQMIGAHHRERGDFSRDEILIPDSAHGTNPASAAMAGFKAVAVHSDAEGNIDLDHLRSLISDKTAGLMITCPSTLGLFCGNILEVTEAVHGCGGLVYCDGANLNAIMEVVRPGAMGIDIMHVNLHKTFATPHGGGGPGAGPVLCKEFLEPYIPGFRVVKDAEGYRFEGHGPKSIGSVATFYGNFGVLIRAYLYLKINGRQGLRRVAENAVLSANYLKTKVEGFLNVPYRGRCMHEFVVQADSFLERGVTARDIAKRLLDYGVHAPTVYFPLIVKECLLIEPTETESRATLDRFVEILKGVANEAVETPEIIRNAPHSRAVSRLDEVGAARHPIVSIACGP